MRPALAIVGLGVIILFGFWVCAPANPILESDSPSHHQFLSFRPFGYPAFLALVGSKGALALQPIIASLALSYLGIELFLLTGSALIGAFVMLAIVGNPFLSVYHYEIMTESLYVSALMIFLGLVSRAARRGSLGALAAASTAAGVTIAIRTVGWFSLPLMIMVALLAPKGRLRSATIAASLLPLLIVAGGEYASRYAWHHGQVDSIMSAQLFGKAGTLHAGPRDRASAAAEALEFGFAPIRTFISNAPEGPIRDAIALQYENCMEVPCALALGVEALSDEAMKAALERIAANPFEFLTLTWRHYKLLWTAYGISHPAVAPDYNAFIGSHRPIPFESLVPALLTTAVPVQGAVLAQPLVQALGLLTATLTLIGLVVAASRRRLAPVLIVCIVAATATQGAFLLTALTGLGIRRYMLAMWPAMIVAVACLTCLAARYATRFLTQTHVNFAQLRTSTVFDR